MRPVAEKEVKQEDRMGTRFSKQSLESAASLGEVEFNDTLQLTPEQGFPGELNLEEHLKDPLIAEDFTGRTFEFHDKPGIRLFHRPPVRVFLVENKDGRWIYWGLVRIKEVTHDQENQTTSGKFIIIYIFTPEQMREAHAIIDRNPETDFFNTTIYALLEDLREGKTVTITLNVSDPEDLKLTALVHDLAMIHRIPVVAIIIEPGLVELTPSA